MLKSSDLDIQLFNKFITDVTQAIVNIEKYNLQPTIILASSILVSFLDSYFNNLLDDYPYFRWYSKTVFCLKCFKGKYNG
jgi:DNA-binding XRE family transcriptional regulator